MPINWHRPLFTQMPSLAIWCGVLLGTVYGVAMRIIIESKTAGTGFVIMSYAFLLLVPVVLGLLTVRTHPSPSIAFRLLGPWIPTLLACGVAALLGLEGAICIVMGLPLILLGASIGGALGALGKPRGPAPLAALLVLPFGVGALEGHITAAHELHVVESYIDIAAPASTVWNEIVSVREITPDEFPDALYLYMGFPRPLSAIITGAGVGAIREARFAGGVLFLETVTDWEPERLLSFRIAAQTDRIPASTLDPHVTIGGPYFDVLQGTYRVEPLASDSVRLWLSSELRVSTHFNWYATLWADRIMRSIQETILAVERVRAEARHDPT